MNYCERCHKREDVCECDPNQVDIFAPPPDERFDGDDYVDGRDRNRLGKQLREVYNVMADHLPHTIAEVTERTGYPQQSIARQIRYLRAERFGGHIIERAHLGGGLYSYRMAT